MPFLAYNFAFFFITFVVLTPSICVEFTYRGEKGPEHWGNLSPECAACASGKSQSPIDIITSQTTLNVSLQPIALSYTAAAAKLVNNKFNVEVRFEEGGGDLNVNGKDHKLAQFHLHVPSEHQLDGKQFAAEFHLLHKATDGSLAVVAIMLELGEEDPFISQIGGSLGQITENPEAEVSLGPVDASTILPRVDGFYRYSGSLTTPPCSEGVIWSVVIQARTISAEQVAAIKAALAEDNKDNNRPIQPMNGRKVERP